MSDQVHKSRGSGQATQQGRKSILFVDDDADDRDVFGSVLKDVHPDFEYACAKDGYEALDFLANHAAPVCIYIDVNMPKMNGVELLRALSLHRSYCNIPVFVLSSYYEQEDILRFKRLGAVDYLKKPDNYDDFVKLLAACFKEHVGRN